MDWLILPAAFVVPLVLLVVILAIRYKWSMRKFETDVDPDELDSTPPFSNRRDLWEEHDGVPVHIYERTERNDSFSTDHGRRYDWYTRYEADLPDAFPEDVAIYDLDTFAASDYDEVSREDLDVGIDDLDDDLVLQTDNPRALQDLFDRDEVADTFRHLLRAGVFFGIEDGNVWLEARSAFRHNMDVDRKIRIVANVAERMEEILSEDESTEGRSTGKDASCSDDDESPQGETTDRDAETADDAYVTEW